MIIEIDNRTLFIKVAMISLLKLRTMLDNLEERMLRIAAKRGTIGASRDDLYKELGGIAYSELEQQVQELEQKGYITIQWLGTFDFVITITQEGQELLN